MNELLQMHVETSARLDMLYLQSRGGPEDYQIEAAQEYVGGQNINESVLYRDANTARSIARLSECVAIMSFMSGGITVFGVHFEAQSSSGAQP